jgi:hypothetical protein
MFSAGTNASKEGFYFGINSSNQAQAGMIGFNIAATSAITIDTRHQLILSYDGTSNLSVYLDGTLLGTESPGTINLTYGSTVCWIGNFFGTSGWFNGIIDDVFVGYGEVNSSEVTQIWNAANTTPAAASGTMQIPAGTTVTFGSPVWGPINTWKLRFRYTNAQVATYYLHYQNTNNWIGCQIGGGSIQLLQSINGIQSSFATPVNITLVNGIQYWLVITQFPNYAGNSGAVVATIATDRSGNMGSALYQVGPGAVGSNLIGNAAIGASGNWLGISANSVQIFGPDGWGFGNGGTVVCSGAWDQATTNTVTGAPVASFGGAHRHRAGGDSQLQFQSLRRRNGEHALGHPGRQCDADLRAGRLGEKLGTVIHCTTADLLH